MPLSPEVELTFDPDQEETISSSRTFKLNLNTMEFTGEIIDGIEAIKQFIYLALRVDRFAYPVYSSDYGSELGALLSDPVVTDSFKEMEIPRLITEALIFDERIDRVYDFTIQHISDYFNVKFKVDTAEGTIELEEVLASA